MNPKPVPSREERPPQTNAADANVSASKTGSEADTYGKCLLAMGRAVQNVGMYGTSHPSSLETVADWFSLVSALIRSRGTLTLDSDGHKAVMNGVPVPLSLENVLALALLRKLYTTRAGRLEFLAGFDVNSAMLMAEFLANADATRVAAETNSFGAWVARVQLKHLRVSPLRLREVKEGDLVVSGGVNLKRKAREDKPAGEKPNPEQIAQWAEDLKRDTDQAGRPRSVQRKAVGLLVSFLRGLSDIPPAGMAEQVARAAGDDAGLLPELILKSALIQQELAQRYEEPIADDVVACLRAVLNALQETPEAQAEEGWRKVIQTLTDIEARILERLPILAAGTEEDAQVIREGIRAMQHEVEGAALKREYERKRHALLEVEERIRKFFGSEAGDSVRAPEAPAGTGE